VLCDSAGDRVDMIECPPATAAWMERDAHDEIRSSAGFAGGASCQFNSQMVDHETQRDCGSKGASSTLEAWNPSSNRTLVANQRVAGVQRAAFHQAPGAAANDAVIPAEGVGGLPYRRRRSAARTAIHRSPPGQLAVAGRTQRAAPSRE
jgi:hypothetical protein